jgi:hypothetical protein
MDINALTARLHALGPRFGLNAENEFLTRPGETMMQACHRMGIVDTGELKQSNKSFNHTNLVEPQPVNVASEPEVIPGAVKKLIDVFHTRGYRLAKNDSKNYNLNIVGVRNHAGKTNQFDDEMFVFWRFDKKWQLKKYLITTDPGLSWLVNPQREEGTAILKEGQYISSHKLGKHKGVYDALVQAQPVTVIRDYNRDNRLDYNSGKTQTGIFGINIHRANEKRTSVQVDKWSAGCQVFADPLEFQDFMKICRLSAAEWGNSFSYTLISKSDIS